MRSSIFVLGFLCVLFSLLSCRTKTVVIENETVRTDALYKSSVKTDSVYLRDSIWVLQKGDTLIVEKYKIQYHDRLRIDTVYKAKCDTVIRTNTEYIEVEKREGLMSKFLKAVGICAIGTLFAVLVILLMYWKGLF